MHVQLRHRRVQKSGTDYTISGMQSRETTLFEDATRSTASTPDKKPVRFQQERHEATHHYLRSLVKEGKLKLRYPDRITHPKQVCKTADSTLKTNAHPRTRHRPRFDCSRRIEIQID